MKALLRMAALVALLSLPGMAFAQADDREAEMFGGSDEEMAGDAEVEGTGDTEALNRLGTSEEDRDDAIFGGQYGGAEFGDKEFELLTKDRLQMGGMLYLRYTASGYDGEGYDPATTMPNLLDLYVDGRPNDRVRGFVKGRLTFDPVTTTAFPGMPASAVEEIQDYAEELKNTPGVPQEAIDQLDAMTARPDPTRAILDQFWLKFDIARRVYVTVGKQPLHWGTTRLWNPVDVVNSTRREPLALFDSRTGVSALKLHVPIESLAWNVIGLLLLEGADEMSELGGALRLEMALATMEIGLTGMVRTDILADGSEMVIPKVGLDWSAGIWELDFTAEASASFQDTTRLHDFEVGDREVLLQVAGGMSYTHKYSDEDFLITGIEYFFNPDGYSSKDAYASLYTSPGAFTPFYLGKHYGAFYISLPSPGNWDYTSFTLSNIANFSDMSFVSRFDYGVTVLTYLTLQAYLQVHYGEPGGEFRFGLDEDALFPGSPEIPNQLFTVGLNLRIDI